mgnify:CR=1 FL=1
MTMSKSRWCARLALGLALGAGIGLVGSAGQGAALMETVTNSRAGVMPAWSRDFRPAQGLSEAQIRAVATYVHALGGGE